MAETLLQRVANGDQQALAELTDRYGGLVWSLARRFCYGTAEAEDAVQEIFVDLWKSAGRFDPAVAGEATFVAMIARRRLIDRRRRAGRIPPVSALSEGVEPAHERTEANPLEVREEAAAATEALETLRPEQQRVLRLSIYQGLSHEKIAETTGLPLGTVKTHMRRGLIRLRERLTGSGGASPDAAS